MKNWRPNKRKIKNNSFFPGDSRKRPRCFYCKLLLSEIFYHREYFTKYFVFLSRWTFYFKRNSLSLIKVLLFLMESKSAHQFTFYHLIFGPDLQQAKIPDFLLEILLSRVQRFSCASCIPQDWLQWPGTRTCWCSSAAKFSSPHQPSLFWIFSTFEKTNKSHNLVLCKNRIIFHQNQVMTHLFESFC